MSTRFGRASFVARIAATAAVLMTIHSVALAQDDNLNSDSQREYTPDLRDADVPATAQNGNFVFAPIPFANPLLDTGLVLGVGHFHRQTAEQAKAQPASLSALGVMYSEGGSNGAAIGHSGYFKEDRWRVAGAYGYADLELPLLAVDSGAAQVSIDWLIKATLLASRVSRRIGKNWFAGFSLVNVDVEQKFSLDIVERNFGLSNSFTSTGVGPMITYDSRDMPTNAYAGRYFKASALFNRGSLGSDLTYDAYSLIFRSYHPLTDSFVLAWEVEACGRSVGTPLWDACKIGLRGFPATNYMGRFSVSAQAEARWRFTERWGLAAFVGSGRVDDTLSGLRENDRVPSYGAGLRFIIQKEKRINLRLDYAQSRDDDAVSFFVGEAF
jgi:hypothetical protein